VRVRSIVFGLVEHCLCIWSGGTYAICVLKHCCTTALLHYCTVALFVDIVFLWRCVLPVCSEQCM
jgi:hypothetical protein